MTGITGAQGINIIKLFIDMAQNIRYNLSHKEKTMSFQTFKREKKEKPEPKRAGKDGGSVYNKVVRGQVQTMLSVSKTFQKTHNLEKFKYVVLKFDAKNGLLKLIFTNKEIENVTIKVERNGGTAYVNISPLLRRNDLRLAQNLYRETFVINQGGVLVDLGDNLAKAVKLKRTRSADGTFKRFTRADKVKKKKFLESVSEA